MEERKLTNKERLQAKADLNRMLELFTLTIERAEREQISLLEAKSKVGQENMAEILAIKQRTATFRAKLEE